VTLKPNPRARALDLAVPVASCAAAGVGFGHLLDGASRDELLALVAVLAAAVDPVRLRAVVRHPGQPVMTSEARTEALRRAHATFTRLTRAKLPVPYELQVLNGEYQLDVLRRRAAAKQAAEAEQLALPPQLEPCPSLAAYRRHQKAGEPFEECGCGDAARAVWRARKRRAA